MTKDLRSIAKAGMPEELDPETPEPTHDGYYEFKLLGDGTYEIKVKDENNMHKKRAAPAVLFEL